MERLKEYLLMNKDNEILKFIAETNEYNEVLLQQIDEKNTDSVLPVGFEDVHSFVEKRQAPKHRKHIQKLLIESGCANLQGFMDISHALSLTDTYWVKEAGSNLSWDDVSLYKNSFNEIIAHMAFGENSDGSLSSTSPEFSTDGTYAKCWIRDENDDIFLIKTGLNEDGIEPYSEFYASQLSSIICNSSVDYTIQSYHDKIVSKCPIFTSEKEGYIPAGKIIEPKEHDKISYLMKVFSNIGCEDDFRRMILLDALIINIDRHSGNYGFIVDNDTQEIKRMAPVFDHNRSLLYSLEENKLDSIEEYMKLQVPRIGSDFNTAANLVLTPELKAEIKNLRYFTFSRDKEFNLSEKRIKCLEQMITNQIDNILNSRMLYFYRSLKK